MGKEPVKKTPVITPSVPSTSELLARTVDRAGFGWGIDRRSVQPLATSLSPVEPRREDKRAS